MILSIVGVAENILQPSYGVWQRASSVKQILGVTLYEILRHGSCDGDPWQVNPYGATFALHVRRGQIAFVPCLFFVGVVTMPV